MLADVEQLDKTFKTIEIPDPKCGEAYCDTCGDRLICYPHDEEEWCWGGGYWVLYIDNKLNPYYQENIEKEENERKERIEDMKEFKIKGNIK